jgi:hypothetical protein
MDTAVLRFDDFGHRWRWQVTVKTWQVQGHCTTFQEARDVGVSVIRQRWSGDYTCYINDRNYVDLSEAELHRIVNRLPETVVDMPDVPLINKSEEDYDFIEDEEYLSNGYTKGAGTLE